MGKKSIQENEQEYTIVVHPCMHWDEAVAIMFFYLYGDKKYPGIKKAAIEIYESKKEYTDKKYIIIGVGGSVFDEHKTPNSNGSKNNCAATLVAKHLGIYDLPELQQILKYTLRSDNNPATSPFEVASLFNLVSREYPDKPRKALNVAKEFIIAKIEEQKHFFNAIKTFMRNINIAPLIGIDGSHYNIGVIRTPNKGILQAARYINKNSFNKPEYHGYETDILVIFRSDGHCQIFNTQYHPIDLTPIARQIRIAELTKKGISCEDRTDLSDIGVIADVPEWCLANSGQLLNGSFSSPNTKATHLLRDELLRALIIALNPKIQ